MPPQGSGMMHHYAGTCPHAKIEGRRGWIFMLCSIRLLMCSRAVDAPPITRSNGSSTSMMRTQTTLMNDAMTTKLYWHDSHLTQFSAQVVDSFVQDGHHVVVLDQSAFYPGGGGQPCDMGVLNAARVMAVAMAEDGRMLHHLEGDVPCRAGETVTGAID